MRGIRLLAVAVAVAAGIAVATAAEGTDPCQPMMAALFNSPALLNKPPMTVQAVFVFEVRNANPRELKHILAPPFGSRERYSLVIDGYRQLLTYVTGRTGDLAATSHEIQAMCHREVDDGFHLRSVRVVGQGIDVHTGPDVPVIPVGQNTAITTR